MLKEIRNNGIRIKTGLSGIMNAADASYYIGTIPSFDGLSASFIGPACIFDDISANDRLLMSTYPGSRIAIFNTKASAFSGEVAIPESRDIADMKWDTINNNRILCYSRFANGVIPLSYPGLTFGPEIPIAAAGYGFGMEVDAARNRWLIIDQNRNLQVVDAGSQLPVTVLNDSICSNIRQIRMDPFNADRLYIIKNSTTLGILNLTNLTTSSVELPAMVMDIRKHPVPGKRELFTSGDVLAFYDPDTLTLLRSTNPQETPADYFVILNPNPLSETYWTAGGWPFMVHQMVRF